MTLLTLAIMVSMPSAVRAALLAYEGFDYTASAFLTPGSGGAGWFGPWVNVANSGGLVNDGNLTAGGNAPSGFDARSTGNSMYCAQSRAGRLLDCSTNGAFSARGYLDANRQIGADGKTVYLSFMQQAAATTGQYYEFEFHRNGDLNDGGRIAAIGGANSDANVYLRAPNGTTSSIGVGDTAVNFYAVKIVYHAGNDDIYVYRNPAGNTEGANTPTLTKLAQADMSFNGLSVSAFNGAQTAYYDQIRIGESWDDVVGGPAGFITQPATVVANVGQSGSLSALAISDLPINYQWYKNGAVISGAVNTSLSFPSLVSTDAGNYTVVASNSFGSVTSIVAMVSIIDTNANTLLAYEGFGYAAGSLNGQNGGAGWSGGWQNLANSGGTVVSDSLIAGPNSPSGYDARSTGNASYVSSSRAGRFLDTSAVGPFQARGYVDSFGRIGADGKVLYLSFMQQATVIDGSGYYEVEFHRSNLGDGGRMGGVGNDAHDGNVHFRSQFPTGAASTMFDLGAATLDVNFYVVKIVYKHGGLDDVYIYRNPTGANEGDNTPTLTQLAVADMSFDGISLSAFNAGVIQTNDQIRIGESWASVVGGPPGFIVQPKGFVAQLGSSNALVATAISDLAIQYQWFKDGNLLAGQTNPTLALTNILLASGGSYTVTASNTLGRVTSVAAAVSVLNTNNYLLCYEGFDYSAAANLAGLNGGAGWNGGWQDIGGSSGVSVNAGNLIAGVNAPSGYDTRSTGNSSLNSNGNRYGRALDVSTNGTFATHGMVNGNGNVGADGTILYVSFLQQPSLLNSFYEFEFHRDDLGDPGRIAGIGCDSAFVGTNNVGSVFFRAPNGAATLIGNGSTDVNLFVVRIDYVAGADNVFVYRNPVGANESDNVPVLVLPAVSDMTFDGISMAAYDNGVTVKHDQIRMGQSWSDVVGSKVGFIAQPPKQVTGYTFTTGNITALAASDLPVKYQWYHTNSAILNATNASLTLANMQAGDAGEYYVIASNTLGTAKSTTANLTLTPLQITNQPQSQVVYLNQSQSTTLTIGAGGFQVTYQWYFNGNVLSGATNSSLTLSGLQISNGGNYYAVASSGSGSVTSSVAAVTVYGRNNNLFVYDGFNYADGQPLDGTSQNGGTGWNGPWVHVDGNTALTYILTGNLVGDTNVPSGYDSRSIGNSLYNYGGERVGRFFDTASNSELAKRLFVDGNGNVGADGKTVYLSFLLKPNTTSTFYEVGFKRGSLGDGGRIGGLGNDAAGGNVNLRAGGVNNYSLGAGDPSTPGFYVVRIDYKAGNDDVFVYRNSTSLTEPGTSTLTVSNAADMSFNGLSVDAFGGPELAADELRLGATWEDAIGLAVSNLLPPTKTVNGYKVQFACTPGNSYRLQRATDVTGPWTDLTTIIGPSSAFAEYVDTTAPAGNAFYRTVTP
ncbi:MAG: immunoglobulin domain-containing protein [Verrucomicrobiota bacterium]